MTGERYRQVKMILHAALELDPEARAALLAESCAEDPELRAEVEALLRHDSECDRFLEQPAPEALKAAFRLKPGARLGPYQVVQQIGAGGMGEVYRAHDSRFARDVALKLLPSIFAQDPDRLLRFEREARAAGSLNHPNILTVHDFGWQDGAPYLVAELLEGETLRQRLNTTPMDAATAVAYAAQIARGLAAAHATGIVHRDLKPENLFVTRHGAVKILDFGLAKLPEVSSARSEPGMILGSMGYMSPEQIRGEPAGPLSDIFSLGVILFEMLAGKRPFFAETWVQEANAILTSEPADLPRELTGISDCPALARTVRQCLAKRPEDRLKPGDDLAVALESLLSRTDAMPKRKSISWALWGTAAAALATSAFFGVWLLRTSPGTDRGRTSPGADRGRMTFRNGIVSAARFTADGKATVYSAQWDTNDFLVYSVPTDSPNAAPKELASAMLFAVSPRGDLALCLPPRERTQYEVVGVLARMPLSGGTPERLAERISAADWSPKGELVAARVMGGYSQIEYPLGKPLYTGKPGGYIDAVRMSPRGDRIALLDHPQPDDSAGEVTVIDVRSRDHWTISQRFNSMRGLAWSRDGEEVWFAAAEKGIVMELWAARPTGGKARRLNFSVPTYFSVDDTFIGGRALLSYHGLTQSMVYVAPDGTQILLGSEDQPQVRDLAGGLVLYSESGQNTGRDYEAHLSTTEGPAPSDLGAGRPLSLLPNRGAITITAGPPVHLVLLPVTPGKPEPLNAEDIIPFGAAWLPDGNRYIFAGIAHRGNLRYYVQAYGDRESKPIIGDVHYKPRSPIVVSPDGRFVAAVRNDRRVVISPTAGGEAREVPGLEGFTPLRWCNDGKHLVLARYDDPLERAKLWKADAFTGHPARWRELNPPDKVGLLDITPIRVSPDCKAYAYSPLTVHSDVHLVTDLR